MKYPLCQKIFQALGVTEGMSKIETAQRTGQPQQTSIGIDVLSIRSDKAVLRLSIKGRVLFELMEDAEDAFTLSICSYNVDAQSVEGLEAFMRFIGRIAANVAIPAAVRAILLTIAGVAVLHIMTTHANAVDLAHELTG